MPARSSIPTNMYHYRLLPANLRPLVDKFYRSHRSAMRTQAGDTLWVAQTANEIVAALSLRPLAEGQWLTGLFVDPQRRRQKLASDLLQQVRQQHGASIWLFCHPQLEGFYQRQGFCTHDAPPPPLAERLERYRRSKQLLAMCSR